MLLVVLHYFHLIWLFCTVLFLFHMELRLHTLGMSQGLISGFSGFWKDEVGEEFAQEWNIKSALGCSAGVFQIHNRSEVPVGFSDGFSTFHGIHWIHAQDNLRFWACWQEDLKSRHDAGQEPHLSSNSAAQILFRWFMTISYQLLLFEAPAALRKSETAAPDAISSAAKLRKEAEMRTLAHWTGYWKDVARKGKMKHNISR